MTAERKFRDIEFLEAEGAVEGLLGLDRHRQHPATLDLHPPVEKGSRAIVVATGQAYFEIWHRGSL
jgi:hypothetical protein